MNLCCEMPKVFHWGLDLHSLHKSLSLCRISLFVAVSCLGKSEPIKIPPSPDSRKAAKKVDSSASPDLSGSRSSVCSDASNHNSSDTRTAGSATERPSNETHDPLVNGPLVFHNSKISLHDPTTPMATPTGCASAEVLLASQIQGSSPFLVPAVLPSGYPIYRPTGGLTGLPVSGAASAAWLAATSSAANQVCYECRQMCLDRS